jgi:hypothetical protein
LAGTFSPSRRQILLTRLSLTTLAHCSSRQLRDLPIAMAAVLAAQFDEVGGQPLLVEAPWECGVAWIDAVRARVRPAARTALARI